MHFRRRPVQRWFGGLPWCLDFSQVYWLFCICFFLFGCCFITNAGTYIAYIWRCVLVLILSSLCVWFWDRLTCSLLYSLSHLDHELPRFSYLSLHPATWMLGLHVLPTLLSMSSGNPIFIPYSCSEEPSLQSTFIVLFNIVYLFIFSLISYSLL